MSDVLSQLRDAAAEVSRRSRHVRVDVEAIPAYAAALPLGGPARPGPEAGAGPEAEAGADPQATEAAPAEHLAAFHLTLDAINFGSGWFPTLHKRPGQTGYRTIEAGVTERFDREGPWTADELQRISATEIARTLSQDPRHELMGLFAGSLNDLGSHIGHDYDGSFAAAANAGSALALVQRLAGWSSFADVSTYDGLTIPFLKRAQIAAADLARAGAARFDDLEKLTMFADNLVPHVLRLDGVLEFDPALIDRIETEQLIDHGSAEEVEIRACAVHAVELIVAARPGARAAHVDQLLWLRGQEPRYKSSPRHRSRCTAY